MKIEELGLSARAYHVLQTAKIETVEQLREAPYNPFVKIGSIGSSVFNEIQEKLAAHTLTNGDRIRAMTDEELSDFLEAVTNACFERSNPRCPNCPMKWSAFCDIDGWLKQPAKEET